MIMIRTGKLKSKMKRIKMNFRTITLLILRCIQSLCFAWLMCFTMRIVLVLFSLYFKDIFSQNETFKFNRVPDEPKMQSTICDYCKISSKNTFCLHRYKSSFELWSTF